MTLPSTRRRLPLTIALSRARTAASVLDRLIEQQRVGDAVAGVGVDDEPLLVGDDDLLGRRLEIEQAVVVEDDVLDERPLDLQAGLANDPPRLAELQHQRLLGLVDDEERAHREDAADDQHDAR